MSACLRRFQWRPNAPIPSLHEPGRHDRKRMGRAVRCCRPPGQRRQARRAAGAGSACSPGKTARRRGSSCPPDSWPADPASASRSRSPGRTSVPGTGPAMPPTSAAGWNTDQMPRLREPGIARARSWCQQPVPGHARDRVRAEMRCRPAAADDRRVPAAPGARARWQRNGRGSRSFRLRYTRGHQDLGAVLARPSPALPPV
jgi:hypothetical protein